MSQNVEQEVNLPEEAMPAFKVICSWCGAVIRSSTGETRGQMCLICHARMLNDYFQRLRHISDEKKLD